MLSTIRTGSKLPFIFLILYNCFSAYGFSNPSLQKPYTVSSALAASSTADRVATCVAGVSYASTAVVAWSEASVYLSGCGPLQLPDVIERSSYLVVLLVASFFWFDRIAFQNDLKNGICTQLSPGTIKLITLTEALAYAVVLSAVLVLANQVLSGAKMDGMSGIDLELCKTRRAFQSL
jgi:hypothetical protein